MEELKKLYEELQAIPDDDVEAREKLWMEIIHKNKVLLKEKQDQINSLIMNRAGDLKELTKDLEKLKDLIKKTDPNNRTEDT
ncbi:MAG: hypothetical protein GF317_03780 [Candidatus Lokiarchaeota archaeon]|nr:hypothetical protein [Candidatus Lokiarchaeota archaeon]MBD3199008.1 hypothetical protein [Candidatus Lokiarchaeota archaeon]